jgi:hypothetical protein
MDDSITYSQMLLMNRWAGAQDAQAFFTAIPSADVSQSVRWQCFLMYLQPGDPNDRGVMQSGEGLSPSLAYEDLRRRCRSEGFRKWVPFSPRPPVEPVFAISVFKLKKGRPVDFDGNSFFVSYVDDASLNVALERLNSAVLNPFAIDFQLMYPGVAPVIEPAEFEERILDLFGSKRTTVKA